MRRASRARDRLVHEHAAEVIGAGRQAQRRAVRSHLHPRRLDIDDQRIEHQTRNRVHQHGLAERRPLARTALDVNRRFHRHERQRHEFREHPGFRLQRADAQQMPRPMIVAIDVAEHDRRRRPQPNVVRRAHDLEPLRRRYLIRAQDRPHLVIENFRRRARHAGETGRFEISQILPQRHIE